MSQNSSHLRIRKAPLHLLTVIGARPQIIKAAAVSRAIANGFSDTITEHILHTGQHYDSNMSQVFFDELGIPRAEYNLGVGSGTHGAQTAKMIAGIEEVLLQQPFDGIILYGDTNSTLAGAVAAAKLHIPIFHIEAGLRSFNMDMPEEINRIVCDQLSTLLFAPTQTAVDNLQRIATEGRIGGQRQQIILSGDVMYDNSLHFARIAAERCDIMQRLALPREGYILATIHRDHNTDQSERLESILRALCHIAHTENIPVVLPLHPRTRGKLTPLHQSLLEAEPLVRILPPLPFLEMTLLEQNALLVMTDSGGVQKEAFFFERPCVILRSETEWVEIVQHHAGIIADADYKRILDAYGQLAHRPVHFPPLFGDGHAAENILNHIVEFLTGLSR